MSQAEEFFEQIKLFLPKYLTPGQTRELFSELSRFPENVGFYLSSSQYRDELMQGDGWRGLVLIDFFSKEERSVAGVVLSNSCDISVENVRTLPTSVLFSPLISLPRYIQRLHEAGLRQEQIDGTLAAIRRQHITNVFYLPPGSGGREEGLILLDNIHAHPLPDFIARDCTKLFTLNQYAFYIFLIKLSIHFSRFQEGVARF